jgi:hypothetical protein
MNESRSRGQEQDSPTFPFIQNLLQRSRHGRGNGSATGAHRAWLLRWGRQARGMSPGRQFALEASSAFPYLRFKTLSISTVPVPVEVASIAVNAGGPPAEAAGMPGSAGKEGASLITYDCPGGRDQDEMHLCTPSCSCSCGCGCGGCGGGCGCN